MNKRHGMAALVVTLGTLATGTAFAQSATYYAPAVPAHTFPTPAQSAMVARPGFPQRPIVMRPGWMAPSMYGMQVRIRMNSASRDVRLGVQTHRVNPIALNVLAQEQARIEQALAIASADGVIIPLERMRINAMLSNLDQLDTQYRVRFRPGFGHSYSSGYGRR
jgi:hypothetical protein